MISIRLIGGLGNQLFQYAFAYAIARENKKMIYIDFTWLKQFEKKNNVDIFGLKIFNINLENMVIDRYRFLSRLEDYFNKILPSIFKYVIYESNIEFDENVLKKKCVKKIKVKGGYWQSYKYFEKYENEIRSLFSTKINYNSEYSKNIEECNSVGIHIRRGDYVNNMKLNSIYGNFGLEYYYNAIDYIQGIVKNPKLFIFSDDIEWCKLNFMNKNSNVVFVNSFSKNNIGHSPDGYRDFLLLSMCKHQIIANSSYSWWAAWLNKNKNKIVIAPKNWYYKKFELEDLIPKSWILL